MTIVTMRTGRYDGERAKEDVMANTQRKLQWQFGGTANGEECQGQQRGEELNVGSDG